jgi:hypothetical protein
LAGPMLRRNGCQRLGHLPRKQLSFLTLISILKRIGNGSNADFFQKTHEKSRQWKIIQTNTFEKQFVTPKARGGLLRNLALDRIYGERCGVANTAERVVEFELCQLREILRTILEISPV